MTKLIVEFIELPRFRDDVAHFVVTDGEIERIKHNLAKDPFLGEVVAGHPRLFEYGYRQDVVTYALEFTRDHQTIYLLTIEPKNRRNDRQRRHRDIEKWLDRIGKLVGIWSGWPRE